MTIERIESGIPGLDKLIEGGFVKNSVNLVAGTTGSGKTLFSCQYLLHGLKNGENGVYITLEESKDEILADVSRFGWDEEFKKYITQKKFVIESTFPTNIKKLGEFAFDLIEKVNAKRFVLDSLSVATMGWEESTDVAKLRRGSFDFINLLKKRGVTSLLITEIPETEIKALSRFGFEEFVADGVIILNYLEYAVGGTPRSLIIRKMRRTEHGIDVYPFEIAKNGIIVKKA